MKFKILALVLVAVLLLFAGCAKKGETAEVGTTAGASGGTGTSAGGSSSGGTSGSGASSGSGTTDVGNLFKIDTDKPEEGSGYNVPAPSGN